MPIFNLGTLKKTILPAILLAASGGLAAVLLAGIKSPSLAIFSCTDRGWALLYGLPHEMIGFNMPLLNVFMTFIDHEPRRLVLAMDAAFILLFFSAFTLGRMKGGRLAGALYVVIAVLISFSQPIPLDPEQLFFTLFIIVYLNMEAVRAAAPGLARSFLAGLALGATLLIRSTLFLFPLVQAVMELLRGGRSRRAMLKETLVFLVGAYILLVPWARLNHFISRRFILFENERAVANIITGAKGSVYTMEGNARSLAGLSREDDVLKWAAGEILSAPGAYLSAVAKRIWHVLKMFPFAFLLAALALLYSRGRVDPLLIALCVYMIVIHCLLSIEERYFFPLKYLLGFVMAAGAGSAQPCSQDLPRRGAGASYIIFTLLFTFILFVEYLVLAYPSRAMGGQIGAETVQRKIPDNPALLMSSAETLIRSKRTEEGLAALRVAVGKAGGKKYSDSAEALRIMDSARPADTRPGFMSDYSAPLFIGLRELELGMEKEAGRSLTSAYLKWNEGSNMLRGTPYERDRVILTELRQRNADFQDRILYDALLYWPPERRAAIIGGLERIFPLSDKLALLKFLSMPLRTANDVSALFTLAESPRVMSRAEPGDYGAAAEQLAKALLSARCAAFAGELRAGSEPLRSQLKNNAISKTAASFNSEPLAGDEISCLAKVCSSRDARAAEKLFRLRPSNPLYFVLFLETTAGGKAARARAIERVKDRHNLLLDAADIYSERGDRNKAAELSVAALDSPRLNRDKCRRAAFMLQDAGRYREALTAMTRAADGPGDWKARNDRGVIYMFLGDNRAAEKDFLSALTASPDSWEVRLNLAALHLRTGRREEAAAIYRELLRLATLPAGARSVILGELAEQGAAPRR